MQHFIFISNTAAPSVASRRLNQLSINWKILIDSTQDIGEQTKLLNFLLFNSKLSCFYFIRFSMDHIIISKYVTIISVCYRETKTYFSLILNKLKLVNIVKHMFETDYLNKNTFDTVRILVTDCLLWWRYQFFVYVMSE